MRGRTFRRVTALLLILLLTILFVTSCVPSKRSVNGFAMGASYYVDYSFGSDLSSEIRALLEGVESSYSATFEPSCIFELNRADAGERVSLTEEEYGAISRVFALAEASDFAFDPAVLPLVKLWGFDPPIHGEVPPSSNAIAEILSHSSLSLFSLNEDRTIRKSDDNAMLDLGGAMKGYAAERVRDLLKEKGAAAALVYVGGTIVSVGEDCKIGVTPPRESGERYAFYFVLKDGEICATSGDYERYFEYEGVRYHHILDPETGYPATSDVISATVISTDGMMADAFATAAVVLGSEKALDLFAKSNVRAALITKEKKVITYNVEVTIKDASYVTE